MPTTTPTRGPGPISVTAPGLVSIPGHVPVDLGTAGKVVVPTHKSSDTTTGLLGSLDKLLNPPDLGLTINPATIASHDLQKFGIRLAFAAGGGILFIGGMVLVIGAIWGKTPAPVQKVAKDVGASAVAAAVA